MPTERVRRALERPASPAELEGARHAAVALLIDPSEQVLFVQRVRREGDPWSGHIGLPGGHLEAGESWRQAAIRETEEEVGLVVPASSTLGRLDDLTTPGQLPTRVVRPFVFEVEALEGFTLQPTEVDAVHVVELGSLLAGDGRSSFELAYGGSTWTLPCVDLGGQRLWGMTLRMVDDLLDRIDGRGTGLARPRR